MQDNIRDINNIVPAAIYLTTKNLSSSYGFTANLDLPLRKNVEDKLGDMSPFKYFNRSQHMAYHNLCSVKKAPKGIGAKNMIVGSC